MHIISQPVQTHRSPMPLILAFGLAFGLCNTAAATHPGMAVAQGMGNTVRANPWDPMTAYAAPAMVWIDGRFEVGGSGQIGSDETSYWQVGAYDAQTTKVGFGVFWARHSQDLKPKNSDLPGWKEVDEEFANQIRSSVVAATIGGGGVHHLFGVALGLRYFYRDTKLGGASDAITLAPSVATIISDELYLSLTAENVIPTGLSEAPLAISTGTRWQPSNRLAIAFDSVTDFSSVEGEVRFSPMVGTELRVIKDIPIRAGWFADGVEKSQWVTGGVGIENDTVGLTYGLQMDFWSKETLTHKHAIMLRVSM